MFSTKTQSGYWVMVIVNHGRASCRRQTPSPCVTLEPRLPMGVLQIHSLLLLGTLHTPGCLPVKVPCENSDQWTVWAEAMGMISRITFTKPHLMIPTSHSTSVRWVQRIQQRPLGPPLKWQIHRHKEPTLGIPWQSSG